MKMKIGRNEPCWCGSGKKYKKCHVLRESEPSLPFGAVADAINRGSKYETCLHPDASPHVCGKKIINAHTLQRSRVLQAIISSDNKVSTFLPPKYDKNGQLILQRKGWREASTFTAFCSSHDADTFAPLETEPFSGTAEQIFLIAYRAICWEFYNKIEVLRMATAPRDIIDRGVPEDVQVERQVLLWRQTTGARQGKADLEIVKNMMDIALKTKDYSPFAVYEIVIDGPLSIASTGAVTPCWSLTEEQLQDLENPKRSQWLAFGIDVNGNTVSVVFLWSQTDIAPQKYIESINALNDQQLAEFLVQFFFSYCENTYFAEAWWNSLRENDQLLLRQLMNNANPYYDKPQFELDRTIAPWKVIARKLIAPL